MSLKVSFNEIKNLLPQVYPFILVDRVEHYEDYKSIICLKNITGNEWWIPGHFPDQAVLPGVLIIEGIAQAGILLFQLSNKKIDRQDEVSVDNKSPFLLTSVKTRFLKKVIPGDQLVYHCNVVKMTSSAGIIEGIAKVDEEVVAKAELVFCIG
ncbi:3-hydroxyacyl-ACP dehydratase FabZ [Bacillus gaemokensis]|uniref:3-hydroxyacyl-[acyl-carrier-protein] dehydratase n=1 Tax=Bacillus gaemokensis TaxID=574375 RepID=A0A073KHB2_9BACI|nr:3-hydroxyacyl-ACP dehydratase FabZ [Bacillus gaemokensis]KEK21728.1 hypothetical protein BAGA_26260 [Bacillus gaemokensis]KYG38293.1 hypothetical protein AZF08_18320 [Bacillus gaemokensis]